MTTSTKKQKTDKFGRLLWTVVLKNGEHYFASGDKEEIRKNFSVTGAETRSRGGDIRISQIRAKFE